MGKNSFISASVRITERILGAVPILARFYMAPYQTVVQKEIELACLKPGERVLQIGAGSIPFTAIHLAQLAKVRVCAIDRDQQAVLRARQFIKKLRLTDCIQVEVGDGCNYPLDDFTAAFVALQAEPKREIIAHFVKNGGQGIRTVVRQPRKEFFSQYSAVPKTWPYQGKTAQEMLTFASSLLFIKGMYEASD